MRKIMTCIALGSAALVLSGCKDTKDEAAPTSEVMPAPEDAEQADPEPMASDGAAPAPESAPAASSEDPDDRTGPDERRPAQ